MCELLVRIADQPRAPADRPDLDCQRTRRGDVIVAVPDGHPWSEAERSYPEWAILRVPGMAIEEGLALTVPEPDDGTHRRYRWRRLFTLDLDADASTPADTLTPQRVRAMRRRRDPYPDPDVIG